MRVKKKIAAGIFCVAIVAAANAHAIIPVTDAGSIAQQIISYAMQLQQYSNQVQQLQNQYQQLANEAQNLKNLNWQAPLSDLNNLSQIMRNVQGIAASYSTAQSQFQKLYPDFNSYSGMTGSGYLQQAAAWQRQNRNAAQDTMNIQAMLRDAVQSDRNTVYSASNRSAAAQGTRDALQATNQLLAVVSKQLMQLQTLLSSTASLDAGYAAERASKEAAAQQRNQDRFAGWNNIGARTVRTNWGTLH